MFEAEDWTAVKVHEGQQALNSCVHAAVHKDAGKTHYTEKSNTTHKMKEKLTNTSKVL